MRIPGQIDLANQDGAADAHSRRNDGQIDPRKVELPDVDVLSCENVAPEQAGERGTEGSAESAVVEPEGHAVDGSPEGAVSDRAMTRRVVDLLPGLDDTREKDGRADVCAGELRDNVSKTSDSRSRSVQ